MNRDHIRKFKGISGIGLQANKDLPRGAFVVEYTGKLVRAGKEKRGRYLMLANARWTIDGSSRKNLARYLNHSCKPNCQAYAVRNRRVKIYTLRRVRAGEELTIDYGKEYFDDYLKGKCRCSLCNRSAK